MLYINGMEISVPRGDGCVLTFTFTSETVNGMECLFSVKRKTCMQNASIEKRVPIQNQRAQIMLSHEDTDMDVGEYKWDIRILQGGVPNTPIQPQRFCVLEVVGNV